MPSLLIRNIDQALRDQLKAGHERIIVRLSGKRARRFGLPSRAMRANLDPRA
jgi:hypothetical protein